MVKIAGIDGCGARWLAVSQEPGSRTLEATLLETEELAAQPWALAAIDIPIGLPEMGSRVADIQARKFIQPRGSSVFPCPIRPAISARTWGEACDITHAHDGRKVSQQTFAIMSKIRDVDECVRSTSLNDRLFEVHPEVCFAAWQGIPMLHSKRDRRGQEQRQFLIDSFFGESTFANVSKQVQGQRVAPDDVADALAALWSAHRIFSGKAVRFPVAPEFDSFGLPMHIWF